MDIKEFTQQTEKAFDALVALVNQVSDLEPAYGPLAVSAFSDGMDRVVRAIDRLNDHLEQVADEQEAELLERKERLEAEIEAFGSAESGRFLGMAMVETCRTARESKRLRMDKKRADGQALGEAMATAFGEAYKATVESKDFV